MITEFMERHILQTIFAYVTALVIIVGGGVVLFATRSDSGTENIQLAVIGFMGIAINWVFGSETAARTAQATVKTYAAGVAVPTPSNGNSPNIDRSNV